MDVACVCCIRQKQQYMRKLPIKKDGVKHVAFLRNCSLNGYWLFLYHGYFQKHV
jgi:hypothetical protein